MDWDGVIERNREALKRVLAALVAMARLGAGPSSPLHPELVEGVGEDGPARRGKAEALAGPGEGYCSRSTLPRHLHRAVLRLLRPAEAAARRLVVVAARDIVLPSPDPSRQRKPKLEPIAPVLRSLGIAVVVPNNVSHLEVGDNPTPRRTPARKMTLSLLDPLRVPRPGRYRAVPPHAAPRILSFDGARPHRLPPPPAPDDPIDATRLALRLEALGRALDDLPGHARRFARWRSRNAAGAQSREACHSGRTRRSPLWKGVGDGGNRSVRHSPLRPGRPPGLSAAKRLRPTLELYEVLGDLQYFAFKALQPPDTS